MNVDSLPEPEQSARGRVKMERARHDDAAEARASLVDHQSNAVATGTVLTQAAQMIRAAKTVSHAETEYLADQQADGVAELGNWFARYAAEIHAQLRDGED